MSQLSDDEKINGSNDLPQLAQAEGSNSEILPTTEEKTTRDGWEDGICSDMMAHGVHQLLSNGKKSTLTKMTQHLNMDEQEIKQLVQKYFLFMEQERLRRTVKLEDVSPCGPPHTALKSFALIPDNIPRILVIGEMRVGKSSICNKFAGVYYQMIEKTRNSNDPNNTDTDSDIDTDDEVEYIVEIPNGGQKEIFKSGATVHSVTQQTSWSQVNYLGNEQCPLIIIDTPGLNEKNDSKTELHRIDLKQKLVALQRIDVVLILLGKNAIGGGAGCTKSTFTMISDILSLFGGNKEFYKHFAFGFTQCDEHDRNWKQNYSKQKKEWKTFLQKEFFGDFEDKISIEFYKFSSIQDETNLNKDGNAKWSQYKQFEKFYKHVETSHLESLYTNNYYLMRRMQRTIEHIESSEKLQTPEDALEHLLEEMVSAKRELNANYVANTRYLQIIPKTTVDGFIRAGRSVVSCVAFGGSCLIQFPKQISRQLWQKNNSNGQFSASSIAARAAATVVAVPVAAVAGTVAAASAAAFGVLGGLAHAAMGAVNHTKTMKDENYYEKKMEEVRDDYYRKDSKIIEAAITRQTASIKSPRLSFLGQLYTKYLQFSEETFDKLADKTNNNTDQSESLIGNQNNTE